LSDYSSHTGQEAELVDVSGRALQHSSLNSSAVVPGSSPASRSSSSSSDSGTSSSDSSRTATSSSTSSSERHQDWLSDWAPSPGSLDWGAGEGSTGEGTFLVLDPRQDEQLQLHRNGKWLQVGGLVMVVCHPA
jgi:hypothetical protein